MRFVAIAFILLSYPLIVAWLNANPRQRHWAYFALGILPFTLNSWNLDAGLINWAAWPGYAKGMVITLMDSIALAIITTHRRPRGMPPMSGFIIAYFLAACVSIAMSNVPMGSAFYAFQLLRMLLVVVAIAKIAPDPRALNWLAMGLAAGISYQAVYTISQKLEGAFQAAGTMGHQNLLGLMTHFVTLPLLAMLLGGIRNRIIMLGVFAGFIVIALGASRGAIGFGMIGVASLVVLSLIRRSTPRKWQMVGFAVFAVLLASPLMINAINNRLGQLEEQGGTYDERAAFERAAKAMWSDAPMGVGANQYVVIANTKGYSKRAGVVWTQTSRSANVHNTYLLVGAETGWLGFLTFSALFAAVIIAGLRFAFQNRRDPRGDIVLGCTVAVMTTALHNLYEWVWVTYQAQYVFGISMGIVAGMMRARALERRTRPASSVTHPTSDMAPQGGQS